VVCSEEGIELWQAEEVVVVVVWLEHIVVGGGEEVWEAWIGKSTATEDDGWMG
jgi:hypothetical protein